MSNISEKDILVLKLIHEGKSMQQIADDPAIRLSKAWTQIVCAKLEDIGLVHNPFKKDRYAKGVKRTLTRKGRALLEREGLLKEANGSEPH